MARGGYRPGAGRKKAGVQAAAKPKKRTPKPTTTAQGGKREGAGRKLGATDIATGEQRQTLTELARQHTELALGVLVKIAQKGQSEKARVSAANALLDRGYGKPRQALEHHGLTSDDEPIKFTINIGDRGNDETTKQRP